VQDGAEVKWEEFTQDYRIRGIVTLYGYIVMICDIFYVFLVSIHGDSEVDLRE